MEYPTCHMYLLGIYTEKIKWLARGVFHGIPLKKRGITSTCIYRRRTCSVQGSFHKTFMYCENVTLPEHPSASVGQSLFSCASPTQSSPPFAGGGLVQVLVRVLNPWRQYVGSEHVVQAVQVVNTPSTAPYENNHFVLILFFSFLSSRGSFFVFKSLIQCSFL